MDGVIHAFGVEFPASAKPFYAPQIERIEDSFRVRTPASSASLASGGGRPQPIQTPGIAEQQRDPLVIY
jgi:hypothetical protein